MFSLSGDRGSTFRPAGSPPRVVLGPRHRCRAAQSRADTLTNLYIFIPVRERDQRRRRGTRWARQPPCAWTADGRSVTMLAARPVGDRATSTVSVGVDHECRIFTPGILVSIVLDMGIAYRENVDEAKGGAVRRLRRNCATTPSRARSSGRPWSISSPPTPSATGLHLVKSGFKTWPGKHGVSGPCLNTACKEGFATKAVSASRSLPATRRLSSGNRTTGATQPNPHAKPPAGMWRQDQNGRNRPTIPRETERRRPLADGETAQAPQKQPRTGREKPPPPEIAGLSRRTGYSAAEPKTDVHRNLKNSPSSCLPTIVTRGRDRATLGM